MHSRIVFRQIALPLFSLVLLGCQAPDEPSPRATAVAAAPPKPIVDVAKQASATATAPEPSTDQSQLIAVDEFIPPFPDRMELFEPPKRAKGTMRQDDQSGETVELKGFVNVDQQRVLLSIDGVIAPIPEGGEKYGVQVISIQPPSVVLQRG